MYDLILPRLYYNIINRRIVIKLYLPTKLKPQDMVAVTPGGVNGHKIFHTWSTSSGQSAINGRYSFSYLMCELFSSHMRY